jgi:transposase-like protein
VIQGAWIGGFSTRPVDEVVQAMGLSGISKSQVSKLCRAGSAIPTIHNGALDVVPRVPLQLPHDSVL